MSTLFVPIPTADPIGNRKRERYWGKGEQFDPQEEILTPTWLDYFTSREQRLQQTPNTINSEQLTAQTASIAATDITDGTISGGLYRLNYYFQVTTPASVSSSLQVTLDWTNNGVGQTYAGAAEAGNVTTTYQAHTLPIHVDPLSPVRYTVTYASVGTPMVYALYVWLEQAIV